jgi:hypothetical protein
MSGMDPLGAFAPDFSCASGTEVVSVGSVFAREIQGVQCYLVVAIVPDRDGKDWVPSQLILDATQNYMVAAVNRMTLPRRQTPHLDE